MTKKEMFAEIRNMVIDNAEMVAFIDREIELLNKKASATRKPTKIQVENEGLKEDIVAYLTKADAPRTIKEMQTEIPTMLGLTNQRISHLLKALVDTNVVAKDYVKKVPYFSIA